MILSDLNHTERLEKEHPLFKQLFDYIRANDLFNAPLGRIELDGDRLFINNCETQGNPAEKLRLEAHRVYADVHVLLEGEETLGWSNTDDLREEDAPYNAEDDIVFFRERPQTFVTMRPGQCLVVYPEDAHAPLIGNGRIRKLVAKVRLA